MLTSKCHAIVIASQECSFWQMDQSDCVLVVLICCKDMPVLDIEIRQRTGHCMRRHVTSEREPCAFEKKKVMKLNS